MTRIFAVCYIALLLTGRVAAQQAPYTKPLPDFCLVPAEAELYKVINAYRKQKGLPGIKLSASLSYVARTHARDQAANFERDTRCNMHSWSENPAWSSCCYTPDHKQGKCMWDKPRELTNYKGDGFEISFWTTKQFLTPEDAAADILEGWKKSSGHNDMIVNRHMWKDVEWKAIGIGIYGGYANVWFGEVVDSIGNPRSCE